MSKVNKPILSLKQVIMIIFICVILFLIGFVVVYVKAGSEKFVQANFKGS